MKSLFIVMSAFLLSSGAVAGDDRPVSKSDMTKFGAACEKGLTGWIASDTGADLKKLLSDKGFVTSVKQSCQKKLDSMLKYKSTRELLSDPDSYGCLAAADIVTDQYEHDGHVHKLWKPTLSRMADIAEKFCGFTEPESRLGAAFYTSAWTKIK